MKLIISKKRNQIINVEQTACIFVNSEKRIIATLDSGKNIIIDEYDTREEALTAMRILLDRMRNDTICCMPLDIEVRKTLEVDKTTVHHYTNGKKMKSHGGS